MLNILRALNPSDRSTIRTLLQLYRDVDKETKRFVSRSKIHCPHLCGYCCATAKVETTSLELLPLAVYLWSKRKGDFWLKKMHPSRLSKRCMFYKPQPQNLFQGRCTIYAFRPLICRLFGLTFNKNKVGGYAYGGCKIIKKESPQALLKIKTMLKEKPKLRHMTDFSIRLFGLGSALDQKLIPINTAAKEALEKIGFILEKQNSQCKI